MNALPAGISRVTDPGGRDAVRMEGPGGSVLVSLCGAQVLSWLTATGDVLWTASHPEHKKGKPVRGGIPLVFPWFGDHPTDKSLPAHGFARSLEWQLTDAKPGKSIVLETHDDATTRALWPHAFRLQLAVTLSDTLRLQLAVQNTGQAPFRCEEALHSYFSVGDVHSASVHGLEGVPCTETAVAPEASWDPKAPLHFRAETDRVFHGVPDQLSLHAPTLRRVVGLTTRGAQSAIVWNPWPAKCAKLSQMAADDWQHFVCVESANVKQHALELAPGQRHVLSLIIDARPM
jgi:D-hexose-6-phosphate mutarotase